MDDSAILITNYCPRKGVKTAESGRSRCRHQALIFVHRIIPVNTKKEISAGKNIKLRIRGMLVMASMSNHSNKKGNSINWKIATI